MNDEPLFSLRPVNDFERLVWAKSQARRMAEHNRDLLVEIGMLKSELAEQKALNNTEELADLNAEITKLRIENEILKKKLKSVKNHNNNLKKQIGNDYCN